MPVILVKSAQVHERQINYKGEKKLIREQRAAIDLGDGFAQPFMIGLGSEPPYPAGNYDFSPDSFALDDYGNPKLSRYFKLVSLDVTPAKSSAPSPSKS